MLGIDENFKKTESDVWYQSEAEFLYLWLLLQKEKCAMPHYWINSELWIEKCLIELWSLDISPWAPAISLFATNNTVFIQNILRSFHLVDELFHDL